MSILNDARHDAAVIADLAQQAAAREYIELVDDRLVGVIVAEGQNLVQVDLEKYEHHPARKSGHVQVTRPGSFSEYVNRHVHERRTTLWGDVDKAQVVAVLDDHERRESPQPATKTAEAREPRNGEPGWGQHRATLKLAATKEWEHWVKLDGKLVDQQGFAEHVEDGAHVITTPDPATMLEIAQSFRATTGVDFKSSSRLSSGETQLRYEETTTAKAGRTGSLEVPELFTLRMAPFHGAPEYEVTARLRYRISEGRLLLGYRLIRPEQARELAFDDVLEQITRETSLPVLHGTPRP